jgi:phosphatidylethanolamine/phosphatidyl-N-methylethanolamine N-methyltransferase
VKGYPVATWQFVKRFCRSPRTIGAIAPSSAKLAGLMVRPIDFEQARVIVEYGPGSGVFSKQILGRIDPATTLFFGLELDEQMNRLARAQLPGVPIFQDSASNVRKYLDRFEAPFADAIVSGLPWAAFPEELQDAILAETVAGLPPGGIFSTFAYLHGLVLPSGIRFRQKLRHHFATVLTSPIVWGNVPPAIVYWCRK